VKGYKMMATKPETLIVNKLISYIKAQGGDAWHVHGSALQRAGEPDIDGWIPTRWGAAHIKVEVKTPEGRPTALQLVMLRKYHKAGYLVGVVTCVQDLKILVSIWETVIDGGLVGYPTNFRRQLEARSLQDIYKIYVDK